MLQKEIGERIAKLRGDKTQEDLACELYLSREKISMWEQGRRQLKAQDLIDLANHFKVSVNSLLYGKEPEHMSIHHELGLSQTAIETLRQFKSDDVIQGTRERAGMCDALSLALSCRPFLDAVAALLYKEPWDSEPGFYDEAAYDRERKLIQGAFSPDMYAAVLTARISLTLASLRKGESGELQAYAPAERELEATKEYLMRGSQNGKEAGK